MAHNATADLRTYIIHLKGRSRCFVSDNPYEVAKFLHCQNQSVQLRLCICNLPASTHRAFSIDADSAKLRFLLYIWMILSDFFF